MSSDWQELTLADIAEPKGGLVDGPFGSNLPASCYVEKGVPVIRGSNLTVGLERFNSNDFVYVSNETLIRIKRSECLPNDIVFTKKGTLGQTGIVPSDSRYEKYLLSSNQMRLRVNTNLADPEYVYYWVSSNASIEKIKRDSEFTGVPKINLDYLKKFPIVIPKLTVQKKISKILSGFDNIIELNHQINQTLEAMAQAIFKSWFIDFEPVKAKIAAIEAGEDAEDVTRAAMSAISGKTDEELEQLQAEQPEHYIQLKTTAELFPSTMQDSELGEVPEGWKPSSVGAEFDVIMGQSPPGDTYNEDGEGEPFFQGRRDFGWRYPENRVYCTQPNQMAKKGDTLLSVRAPVGDINKATSDCCIGRGIAALRHKSGCEAYTYYSMMDLSRNFKSFDSEGTVFGSINQKDLKALKVLKPSSSIIEVFTHAAGVMDQQILNFDIQIRILSQLRDTLLPKLLSGELPVNAVEVEGVDV